jgi:hypothetical protein
MGSGRRLAWLLAAVLLLLLVVSPPLGLLALWQSIPFVLLAGFYVQRWMTPRGALFSGAIFGAVTVALDVVIFRDDSSTGGIAFLFVPVWLALGVPVACAADHLFRWLASRPLRGKAAC